MHMQCEEIMSLRRLVEEANESTKFMHEIPEFHGLEEHDEVLDWLAAAQHLLDCALVPADRRVRLAAIRFRGDATNWWRSTNRRREQLGEPAMGTWEELEKEMKSYFLPYNYQSSMLAKMLELEQGSLTVHEYTNSFYDFLWKTEHKESGDETTRRYVDGLEWNIRWNLCTHNSKSLEELVNEAKGVEAFE